ncbi:hypothetical protein ElyMa_004633300 [Elysia marginata]|uniref:Uncharacterized protein n=1 Tax=Elysia marginata TaxID=1093978 RepID=A0AAV4I3B1_9GAST|nr:hypothetical protein ElyMa_004633300 [Elysia marginata]
MGRKGRRTRSKYSLTKDTIPSHRHPDGQCHKSIQAIASPPIRAKTLSEEKNELLDSIVEYLKHQTAENSDKLFKCAKSLMLESVAQDQQAAELVAAYGQDRDLLVYLLSRMETQGLDIPTDAWRKLRTAIIKGADSTRLR